VVSRWAALSRAHRRFLLVEHGVGAAAINFAVSGGLAWLESSAGTSVPLWGWSSVALDTLATAFVLPIVTCLLVSRIAQRQLAQHKVSPLRRVQGPFGNGGDYSRARWGVQLGATAVFFFAAPVLFILTRLGVSSFAPWHFVIFEGVFGAALGFAFTPLIVWRAIVDR
jgi:hypothetical protein